MLMHNKLRIAARRPLPPSREAVRTEDRASITHARAREDEGGKGRAMLISAAVQEGEEGNGEGNGFRNNLDDDPIAIILFRSMWKPGRHTSRA